MPEARTLPAMEILIAAAILVMLAIAAPVLGYDSRVIRADRSVRWWPGEPRLAVVPRRVARAGRRARPQPPSARREAPEARAA